MSFQDPFSDTALRRNLKDKTVAGGKKTLVGQMGLFSIQFVTSILLARALEPREFGIVGMATAVLGFLDIFKDLGLTNATVQNPTITRAQVNSLYWINVAAGLTLFAISAAVGPLLAWLYKTQELTLVVVALSSGFILSAASAQQKAIHRRSMEFGTIARNDIISALIAAVLGIWAAYSGFSYWAIVVQSTSKNLVSTLMYFWSSPWKPGRPTVGGEVGSMLRFGGYVSANNVMNYFARNVDNIAIGWKWGAEQLGHYARAYNLLLMPMSQIAGPISNVAMSAFSKIQGDAPRFRDRFGMLVNLIGGLIVPLIGILIAVAPDLIQLLLGGKWATTAVIYQYLGLVAAIQPINSLAGVAFISQGKAKEMAKVTLYNSVLSVIAIFAGLPWGPVGVAIAYSSTGVLIRTPILFYYLTKSTPLSAGDLYRPSVFALGSALVTFSAAFFLGWYLPASMGALPRLVLCSLAGIAGWGVVFLIFRKHTLSLVESVRYLRAKKNDK